MPRSREGTSNGVVGSEKYSGQAGVHDGVYGPWIMVARKKNGTKSVKSGGISPRQNSGFSFRNYGNVEKESVEQAGVLHGPSREVKRKLSHPKLIDRAQIAVVVQNIRSGGPKEAQSSPNLMLMNGGSNDTSFRSKLAIKPQRLSSVKGMKGAARSGFTFGEHSSAGGGKRSVCDMISQPKVSAESVGSFG